MSYLAPSHPLRKYAPFNFLEKIDVLGEHLIWTGSMSGRRVRGGRTHHPVWKQGREISRNVSRLVWEWMTGEVLLEEDILFRKESCIHERCVAPKCFVKGSYRDIPDAGTHWNETHRRVS